MSDLFGNHIVGFSMRWLIYAVLGIEKAFPIGNTTRFCVMIAMFCCDVIIYKDNRKC